MASAVPVKLVGAASRAWSQFAALVFAMAGIQTIEFPTHELQKLEFGHRAVLIRVHLMEDVARLRSRGLGTKRSSEQESYGCPRHKGFRTHDFRPDATSKEM
jgi:hypothetical protein